MTNPFQDLAEMARQMEAETAAHVASCTADPCFRCGRNRCKCGARVRYENDRCADCEAKAERARWLRDVLPHIPAAFSQATLESPWLATLVGPKVIADARAATSAVRVAATGKPGSGKTSLIAAMFAASSFARSAGPPMWISAHGLAKARALHPLGEGESPKIAKALAAGVLVVDELGGEDQRYASAVAEVLYERHAEARATWVTTGVGPAEIADRYGGGIARRVFEDAVVFRLVGRAR